MLRVRRQLVAIIVIVSPDERRRHPRELIEHSLAANVAAVNKEFCAIFPQDLQAGGHCFGAVVGVAENSQNHAIANLPPYFALVQSAKDEVKHLYGTSCAGIRKIIAWRFSCPSTAEARPVIL